MAKLPEPIHTVAALVYDQWQRQGSSEESRGYLGASILGRDCERALWYEFRWASAADFDGRMYRLFNRGQREEEIVFNELRCIGVDVRDFDNSNPQKPRQWSVKAVGGHLRGHLDAAATNVPYGSKSWAVVEVKTHSDKSFTELVSKGVQQSKPEHFAQMQVYMGLTGMNRALYYAVNKNDDRIHTEWLHFGKDEFDSLINKAHRIITAAEPPLRLRDDATYFVCKFCNHAPACHGTETPRVSCRTCAHSTPAMDGERGEWKCEHKEASKLPIRIELQRTGCNEHRYIPALLEKWAEYEGTPDGINPQYKNKLTGNVFHNAEDQAVGISSAEIRDCKDKRAIGNKNIDAFRTTFDARIGE